MNATPAEAVAHRRDMPRSRRSRCFGARALLLGVAALLAQTAYADFEVTAPDGRRIVLKDDGTWRYQQDTSKGDTAPGAKQVGEAELHLDRKIDQGSICRIVLSLHNGLPYEIVSIVPYLSAYRPNGVVFETVSMAFQSIRPGGVQESAADFSGISCSDIARIEVNGGDRCEMGDLNKFSDAKGQCLARIRVVASDLIRFEK